MIRRALLGLLALLLTVPVASAAYDLSSSRTVASPALDAHGHVLRAGGLLTHFERWGRRGSPVVLVHGFVESAQVWSRVGPMLSRAGHRVYALDVRGFGYTQRRGPYTLAGDTAQLRAFLAAEHLDAAHHALPVLLGHSSGAAIVGDLARTDPTAVRRVVFMDGDGTPYGAGPAWVHRLLVDPFATTAIRLATRHTGLLREAYASACGRGCPPFRPTTWVRPFQVAGAEPALKQILQQPLIGLTYAQERRIRVPAAVVYGVHDPEMSAASARSTARRLHTRTVLPIPGSRHLAMLSDPSGFARLVEPLLR